MKKYVYSFHKGLSEGSQNMSSLLGGKGANLAEMGNLGIPVPPGFTISTDVCKYYIKNNKYPRSLKAQVDRGLQILENRMSQKFGCQQNPLLVSVRSGAEVSMPGMMETVLNVGLNKESINGILKETNNKRFAYDSYRRLIMMYSDVVMDKSNNLNNNIRIQLERLITKLKNKRNITNDSHLSASDYELLSKQFLNKINDVFKKPFPQDPYKQLWGAIDAVFKSWNGERAHSYREIENISHDLGTAVNIQAMVFGNMGGNSATGVAFTRNPSTGDNVFFGEWLPNAQGEDVVAGIRTPYPINDISNKNSLKVVMPDIYSELNKIQKKLEHHYKDMQDLEFTIQKNKLWLLQTRNGKRNGQAAIKIALDLIDSEIISKKTGLERINTNHINELLYPTLSQLDKKNKKPIAFGLPAGPGCAYGQIVFDPDQAKTLKNKGYEVILIREETSPEDVNGMFASNAILTARGGMTSHAALVARGWGKCCIVGCNTLQIDYKKRTCIINNKKLKELDWLTLDGSSGLIYDEKLLLTKPNIQKNKPFIKLLKLCSRKKTLEIRANADSEKDAIQSLKLGAKGIGLCRTEHMFFHPKRVHEVRKMILAMNSDDKKKSVKNLLAYQKRDFYKILKTISPYPVTIRLLDPPLHEFIPNNKNSIKNLAKDLEITIPKINAKIESLKELNPMLGHRGCRLGITSPEITEMQASAIFEAALKLKKEKVKCSPEIMIPLVGSIEEFIHQKKIVNSIALNLNKKYKTKLNYSIGAMIELPRACIIADQIAEHADFISFGTNDLTQTTFGFSRDDISTFLPNYIKHNIIKKDPFISIDINGVGELIRIAIKKARSIKPKIKIGICGEHGGDSQSIKFFHKMEFNYISCSPFRLPIAHLAAAKQ